MRGPVFFVTHPPGTKPMSEKYAGQGLEDMATWIEMIYKIARPGEVDKDPLLAEIIGKVLPEGIKKGKIGMCIASLGVASKLEPLVPLPDQGYTKFFTGSIPFHHRQWHVCDNCGAFCQGDMWPGGCTMCLDQEGELYPCDCTSSGGDERETTCPMHGDYGVLTAEHMETENNPLSRDTWKGEKVEAASSAAKIWSQQLAKEVLAKPSQSFYQKARNNSFSRLANLVTGGTKSFSNSSYKGTDGSRMSFLQSKLMVIGGASTLFGCALIGVPELTMVTPMMSWLGVGLMFLGESLGP